MNSATITTIHGPDDPATTEVRRPSARRTRRKRTAATTPRTRGLKPLVTSLRQRVAAGAAVALEVVLTGLSISHQAVGVGIIVVSATEWERWSMAAGIDCTYLVCRASMLCAPDEASRKHVATWALPTSLVAMAISAAQNALANTRDVTPGTAEFWAAAGLGIVLPAAICALGQIAHAGLSAPPAALRAKEATS